MEPRASSMDPPPDALLEGQLAAARGRDPIPVLAVARCEAGLVSPSMAAPLYLARWVVITLVPGFVVSVFSLVRP